MTKGRLCSNSLTGPFITPDIFGLASHAAAHNNTFIILSSSHSVSAHRLYYSSGGSDTSLYPVWSQWAGSRPLWGLSVWYFVTPHSGSCLKNSRAHLVYLTQWGRKWVAAAVASLFVTVLAWRIYSLCKWTSQWFWHVFFCCWFMFERLSSWLRGNLMLLCDQWYC